MAEVCNQPMKNKLILLCLSAVLLSGLTAASTLSVTEVDYIDTDSQFFDDDHVLLQFNLDGTDEQIHASVDSSQLSSAAEGETDQDVQISAEIIDVSAEYEVEDRGLTQISPFSYERNLIDGSEDDAINWANGNCMDLDSSGSANYNLYQQGLLNPWGDWVVNCATQDFNEAVYTPGFLQSPPDTTFEAEWTVDVEGETAERITLSNDGVGEGSQERIGDDVQIEFVSLRDLGSDAPNPQNTFAAFSSSEGWKLIEENEYNDYSDYRENVAPEKVDEMSNMEEWEIDEWDENDVAQNKYLEATSEYTESSIWGAEAVEGENFFQNGVMSYEPSSDFEWFTSEFNVRIDGSFVGLERSFAEPTILNVEDAEIDGITGGVAEVEVRNDGDGTGVFELSATCDQISSVGVTDRVALDPGETSTELISLSADGDEEFTSDCTLIVEDSETTETSQASFQTSYTPDQECTPGTQSVITEGGTETIVECDESGTGLVEVEDCSSDERAVADGSGYTCEMVEGLDVEPGMGDCQVQFLPDFIDDRTDTSYTVTDPICVMQNWWSSLNFGLGLASSLLDVGIAVGAGLLGWIVGNNTVARAFEVNDRTDNELLKTLVAAAVALGFAVFAYSLFSSTLVKILVLALLAVVVYVGWPLIKTFVGVEALKNR